MADPQSVAQGQRIVAEESTWIERELREGAFQDARLLQRLRTLLGQLVQAPS